MVGPSAWYGMVLDLFWKSMVQRGQALDEYTLVYTNTVYVHNFLHFTITKTAATQLQHLTQAAFPPTPSQHQRTSLSS